VGLPKLFAKLYASTTALLFWPALSAAIVTRAASGSSGATVSPALTEALTNAALAAIIVSLVGAAFIEVEKRYEEVEKLADLALAILAYNAPILLAILVAEHAGAPPAQAGAVAAFLPILVEAVIIMAPVKASDP
jgi:hypothetical protein